MKKAVFVTGGAGFIGCALSNDLLKLGLPVVAIDSLHPQIHPSRKRPDALAQDVQLIQEDIVNPDAWDHILGSWTPSIVLHLAAETGTGQSLMEASRHGLVNVVGTTQMLDAFARKGVVPDQIVLTSSRAVYGEGAWIDASGELRYPRPRDVSALKQQRWIPQYSGFPLASPVKQKSTLVAPMPRSVYASTKLAQENILSNWCDAMGSQLKTLRLQNVYGPGQSPFNPYTGIVTLFHRQARSGQAIEVYEDGQIGRDFVIVDDVANAIMAAVRNPQFPGEPIDVGTGFATTILDAAKSIASMHGAPAPIITGKYRAGDVRWAVADTELLQSSLGLKTFVGFSEGNRRLSDWLIRMGYM